VKRLTCFASAPALTSSTALGRRTDSHARLGAVVENSTNNCASIMSGCSPVSLSNTNLLSQFPDSRNVTWELPPGRRGPRNLFICSPRTPRVCNLFLRTVVIDASYGNRLPEPSGLAYTAMYR
jgi:hypothetical protein